MRSVMQNIFGVYNPIVVNDLEGNIIYTGVDWEYIAGILLFTLCLYCFFRILGMVIQK